MTILIPPWDTPGDAGKQWQDEGVDVINVQIDGGIMATTVRLLRELRCRKPHIVHIVKPRAHAGLVHWWLWRQARAKRPRVVLDIDDREQAWAPINHYPWPVARFLAWQEEWGIRHADSITAASRWLEARAQRYAPGTPRLDLPNGVAAPVTPTQTRQPPVRLKLTLLSHALWKWNQPGWLPSGRQCRRRCPAPCLFGCGHPHPTEPGHALPLALAMSAAHHRRVAGLCQPGPTGRSLCANSLRHLPSCPRSVAAGKMQRAPGNHAAGRCPRW